MRIRKQYQVIPTNAKLENGDSTSATNGYTANYINNHSVVVSPTEPTGSARKKVWLRHSSNLLKFTVNLDSYTTAEEVSASEIIITSTNPNPIQPTTTLQTGKLDADTYTIKNYSSKRLYIQTSSGDYSNYIDTNQSYTFTYDGISYLRLVFATQSQNETVNYKAQLEKGEVATTYEAYSEGDKTYILKDNVYKEFNSNEPVVLWKNPSRTAIFSNQTITLNDSLANYKFYEVIFNRTNGDWTISTGRIPTDRNTLLQIFRAYGFIRGVEIASNTTLTIGEATRYDSYGGTSTSINNNYCIPEQILGYK